MLVSWMTTNKCNLKCVHCYQDAEEATDKELSCEEGKKMIDEIARARQRAPPARRYRGA